MIIAFNPIVVILYNCMGLAGSCSQCLGQNINTGFNCGWCSNTDQCTVNSQCGGNHVTTSGGCGAPAITAINPSIGPPGGQTTITIDGTNLGVIFSDILSISVGVRQCDSIENQYSSGVQIVCTINSNNVNIEGTEAVTVIINTSGGNMLATSNLFMIAIPRIVSVTPQFGPVSGGTMVTVIGEYLDIGNKENTRVLFRELSAKRRKRQTCPDRECVIEYVRSYNSQNMFII